MLVDGPPGQIQKHSRYPAIPLLKSYFSKKITIVLDDSTRQDEVEIVDRWISENPEFLLTKISTQKGMSVIKQN